MAALLVSLVFVVQGCTKSKQDLIVGTWKTAMGMNIQITFNNDGTCTFATINAKYRIDGDKLIVSGPALGSDQIVDTTWTIVTLDNKNLSLQDADGKQDYIRVTQ
jgi:hypothetical protein